MSVDDSSEIERLRRELEVITAERDHATGTAPLPGQTTL